jgi:predicted metal-dependent peptidase
MTPLETGQVTVSPAEKIKDIIGQLVLRDSFWGYLFSRVGKIEDESFPSVAGIGALKDGMLYLFYNPIMVSKMNDKDIEVVLSHEGIHILNKHISRLIKIWADETIESEKQKKMLVWNFATDFNANAMINAPDKLMVGDKEIKLLKAKDYKLKDGETSEFYYYKLLEEYEKQKKNFDKSGSGSSHEKWLIEKEGQGSGSETGVGHGKWTSDIKEVSDLYSFARRVEQSTKEMVFKSSKAVRNRGTLPGNLQELINQCLKPPEVPYYQIIKKLVRGSRLAKYKMAYTKINRKRTYLFLTGEKKGLPQISPFPGKTKDTTFNISLISDTSGSMSQEDILESLKGLKSIIESDRYCVTTVIQCDTDVRKEYTVKRVKDIDFEIKGRGGTTLAPGLFRAKELDTDVSLVFTDGYCDNINQIERKLLPKKIIWVLTPDGNKNTIDKTGYIVRIPK